MLLYPTLPMSSIPVTSSIISAAYIGSLVQQQYTLDDSITCRIIKAGISHTYLVTADAAKYVFRVYSLGWRTQGEILEELKLLNHLYQNGIPVSIALADKDNTFIQVLNAPEGQRFGVLFSYAEGEKLHNYAAETHYTTGSIMAALHRQTLNYPLERTTYNARTLLVDSFEELKKFLSAGTEEMAFMTAAQQYLLKELGTANVSMLRKGAVHLDIWFDNMNVDKDGNITLFDFDFCGNGWLCMDVAYYLMQLLVTEPVEQEYNTKASAFLAGYERVEQLSNEEKRLLPMLGACLYFYYLGVQCSRFDDWSNVFISETYLKRYIVARVKKHIDYHQLMAVPTLLQ